MKQANEIVEELRDMGSMLADVPRNMPYHVPDGYFENFTGSVRNTISYLAENEQVPDWGKTMPFAVPEDYFAALPDGLITEGIAAELPKAIPFRAPAGYFEALPAQMLAAAKAADSAKPETRIIPLRGNNVFRQLRWAAAALLVIGLGLGSYHYFFNSTAPASENILASVPSNDIQDYLQHTYRVDVDRIVSNSSVNDLQLDNKDIIQYLNETGWD